VIFDLKKLLYLTVVIWFSAVNAGPKEDFFKAVDGDQPKVVQRLLADGFDPNQRDDQGQVGLFLALRAQSLQVAALLMAHPRTEIDAANTASETPLMMAALRGQTDIARRLLDQGAALQRPGWTPLHYAASGPSTELVRLLLDRGAVIDARSPNGTTPLMMAARYGMLDSADLLRARGADLRLRNEHGMDAAAFAASAGRDRLAERLRVP
jgi:ankyrin repeat protein